MNQRIGIYGISGSGKSFLLNQIHQVPAELLEGSRIIFEISPNFESLSSMEKKSIRNTAIQNIKKEYEQKAVVISGHYSFPCDDGFESVMTVADEKFYTHIIYLDIPADVIYQQRTKDSRYRPQKNASTKFLDEWIEFEKKGLSSACKTNGIELLIVKNLPDAIRLLHEILGVCINDEMACGYLKTLLKDLNLQQVNNIWLVDGDKTLSFDDSGRMFWEKEINDKIKALFNSEGYNLNSFYKVSKLYEMLGDDEYKEKCLKVATNLVLRKPLLELIKKARSQGILVILVSAGIREVWQMVLSRFNIRDLPVIAGNRNHGFVVGPKTKSFIANYCKYFGKVYAFGDSPVDYDMLQNADVGYLIDRGQIIQHSGNVMKLDSFGRDDYFSDLETPKVSYQSVLQLDTENCFFDFTTDTWSMILSSKMRNGNISGYELTMIHQEAGKFLAYKIANVIGHEEISMNHVQGGTFSGFALHHESKTAIVPLLRGGEPMALGIYSSFPKAMFIHAKLSKDVYDSDLKNCKSIIVVDSVLNSGKSIREFLRGIISRKDIAPYSITIHVAVGVVQSDAIHGLVAEFGPNGILNEIKTCIRSVVFYTLRVSKNKYKGVGGTDTGHRLFHTFHRD